MDYDFAKIAKQAAEMGWDEITLLPCGDKTRLERICRKPGRRVDPVCVDIDAPFNALEFKALKGLEAAGWDACFTSAGIRAFKRAGNAAPTKMFQNLPPVPPPPDRSRELRRVA